MDDAYPEVDVGLRRPYLHIVSAGTRLPGRCRFLCLFLHRHLSFRLPEVEGIAESVGKDLGNLSTQDGLPLVVWEPPVRGIYASPYWYFHLPAEIAQVLIDKIAKDSMLVRAVIDVWGEGFTWERVHSQVYQHDSIKRRKYSSETESFRFSVESWGKRLTMEEKKGIVDSFSECTGFQGPVDLKSPKNTWWAIEVGASQDDNLPRLPLWFFFGRQVAVNTSRQTKMRHLDLKSRRYLGPTSMPPELGHIMCSMGAIRKSSIVFDPFVGTGSILVSAAECGAYTLGTDIDMRVIKIGKKDKQTGDSLNAWTNFKDYNLPMPIGLLRADLHRMPLRSGLCEWLDIVLADPPYGVRAGGRKSKSIPGLKVEDRGQHIASTAPYQLSECLRDLMEISARALVIGGRLVYWVPTAPEYFIEEELPKHPCLKMVANCEQCLSSKYGRRLIVMHKFRAYDKSEAQKHWHDVGAPHMKLDQIRDHIYCLGNNGSPQETVDSNRPKNMKRNKYV